ncbi:DUF7455 domain-containing protein [Agromyces subbeticus]|uniref:DUF7455 domain-containing protein n=1 Tax=Agromyces subbeticus TaxID=293890 RepID=UPI00058DD6AC|nr:hypothetical protein [Agromyces subbeticus]
MPTLTAADRCDQCQARAYAVAWFPTGSGPAHSEDRASELLFCGHHFREHRDRIEIKAVRILDETAFILDSFAASERA